MRKMGVIRSVVFLAIFGISVAFGLVQDEIFAYRYEISKFCMKNDGDELISRDCEAHKNNMSFQGWHLIDVKFACNAMYRGDDFGKASHTFISKLARSEGYLSVESFCNRHSISGL